MTCCLISGHEMGRILLVLLHLPAQGTYGLQTLLYRVTEVHEGWICKRTKAETSSERKVLQFIVARLCLKNHQLQAQDSARHFPIYNFSATCRVEFSGPSALTFHMIQNWLSTSGCRKDSGGHSLASEKILRN